MSTEHSTPQSTAQRIIGKLTRSRAVMAKLHTPQDQAKRAALHALSFQHVYAGTVDPETIAKRRAANKAARRSRRANRIHRSR